MADRTLRRRRDRGDRPPRHVRFSRLVLQRSGLPQTASRHPPPLSKQDRQARLVRISDSRRRPLRIRRGGPVERRLRDRKSIEWRRGGAQRVDLGGRRFYKKKK